MANFHVTSSGAQNLQGPTSRVTITVNASLTGTIDVLDATTGTVGNVATITNPTVGESFTYANFVKGVCINPSATCDLTVSTYGSFGTSTTAGLLSATKSNTITGAQTYLQGSFLDKGNEVFNVKGYGAKGDGSTDDSAAIAAAQVDAAIAGGTVWFPPSATGYMVGVSLGLPNGVSYASSGTYAATIKALSSLNGPIFTRTISSGGTITGIKFSDITLDGNTGPTGLVNCIMINTVASSNIVYQDIVCDHVRFQNALAGFWHAANNNNAGPMNNQTLHTKCVYNNCGNGVVVGGAYGTFIQGCFAYGCTRAAFGSGTMGPNPAMPSSGPNTIMQITGCHIEGLGNLTGAGSGTESGVAFKASDGYIANCFISNISKYPIYFQSDEGEGSLINGITIWGSGGSGIFVDADGSTQKAIISNVNMSYVCRNTNLSSTSARSPLTINAGSWDIDHVLVADATTNPPPYAISLGALAPNITGQVQVSNFDCLSVGTAWSIVNNAQSNLKLSFKDCPGFNPVGTVTVTPTSHAWTNNSYTDTEVYVATAGSYTGTTTITPLGGSAVTVPNAVVGMSYTVPANATLTWGVGGTVTTDPTFQGFGN